MNPLSRSLAALLTALALLSCEGNVNETSISVASTLRLSIGPNGEPPDFPSAFASMSADGRYVAFVSISHTLTPDDPDNIPDCFLRDVQNNTTKLISRASGATGAKGISESNDPCISADGRFVSFTTKDAFDVLADTNGTEDVYLRDLVNDTTELVSKSTLGAVGDDRSGESRISADGRYVVFTSFAENIDDPGPDLDPVGDNRADVYVRDRNGAGTTTLVSVSDNLGPLAKGSADSFRPAISSDGNVIAWETFANNLDPGDPIAPPDMAKDIYVRFWTGGTPDTYLMSIPANAMDKEGDKDSYSAHLSADGFTVVFASDSRELAEPLEKDFTDIGTDIYRATWTRVPFTRTISLLSRNASGVQAFEPGFDGTVGSNTDPYITPDGRYVAWSSLCTNLVAGDTNNVRDLFVKDMVTREVLRVSVRTFGNEVNGNSDRPWLSDDGRFVTFYSSASNLVDDDNNGAADVFWRGPLH